MFTSCLKISICVTEMRGKHRVATEKTILCNCDIVWIYFVITLCLLCSSKMHNMFLLKYTYMLLEIFKDIVII